MSWLSVESDASSNNSQPLIETQPLDEEQPSSQEVRDSEASLWGYLHPCSPTVTRVDLYKEQLEYKFGRNPDGNNDVVLPGLKISNNHCTITWNPTTDTVAVQDTSSNGTWIASNKIPKNEWKHLQEGNEISLGAGAPGNADDDYRWLYRHVGNKPRAKQESIWDRYDMGPELGRGTFASVYRCMERSTGRWYAIKVIQRAKFKMSEANERNFVNEIEIMKSLDHPNIVKLIEYAKTEQAYYLVLEEIRGGDLLMHIVGRGGLYEDEAKHLTRDICKAVAYLHKRNITHRDLKPENILLTDDVPPRVKVADFGLAKAVDEQTFLRTMCGTPSYLAPEVVNPRRGGYDNRVDSFSIGTILYAMITNSSPFIEDETLGIHARIAGRQIHWKQLEDCQKISEAGIDFIGRLLADNPNERMTIINALNHRWLSLRSPYSSQISYSSQPAASPNFTDRQPSVTPLMDDPTTYEPSMLLNNEGSPIHVAELPADYSQEFENLRLDSAGDIGRPSMYRSRFSPFPQDEVSESGGIKIPGLSPLDIDSQGSQKARLYVKDGTNDDDNSPVSSKTRPRSSGKRPDTTNGKGKGLPSQSKPIIGKRKAENTSGIYDDDSSSLSSPPSEKFEAESDKHPTPAPEVHVLPKRQAKAPKMSVDDSPAALSHVKPPSQSKAHGSGRAGGKKQQSGTGKGKGIEIPQDDTPAQQAGPSTRAPVRRSARKAAK